MENINMLPAWFLVLSLFLPRISLIAAFFTAGAFPHLFTLWLSIPMAFLIPRVLVIIAIATIMGICPWFWIHLIVAMILFFCGVIAQAGKSN
jgi:hypothetical protein